MLPIACYADPKVFFHSRLHISTWTLTDNGESILMDVICTNGGCFPARMSNPTWFRVQGLGSRGYGLGSRVQSLQDFHFDILGLDILGMIPNELGHSTGNQPIHIHLPIAITPDILFKLKQVCSSHSAHPDIVMLWAACCLAFLHCREFTSTKEGNSAPLQVDGVCVDDHHKPTCISLSRGFHPQESIPVAIMVTQCLQAIAKGISYDVFQYFYKIENTCIVIKK